MKLSNLFLVSALGFVLFSCGGKENQTTETTKESTETQETTTETRTETTQATKWKAGDKVQVDWKGKFYASTVLETKDGKYKIHYDGWSDSWDEWVEESRMRDASIQDANVGKAEDRKETTDARAGGNTETAQGSTGTRKVGDKLEVNWKNAVYKASILEIKDGKYKIRYDGYGETWDEWIGEDRIKK